MNSPFLASPTPAGPDACPAEVFRPLRATEDRSPWTAVALAAALSGMVAWLAWRSSEAYYAVAVHHFDSVAYRLAAAAEHDYYESAGLARTLAHTMQLKDSLDMTLRLLIYPASIDAFYGHLVVGVPFLGLFFWLLLMYVRRRTGSLLLGALVGGSLLMFPIVYHPIYGFADYWKDNLGVWLLASACLAWLLSEHMTRRWWGFAAGLLLGALVMQRTSLSVYGAVLFAPVFFWGVVRTTRSSGWRTACLDGSLFGVPALVLAALVAVLQWDMLYRYYFEVCYGYIPRSQMPRFIQQAINDFGLKYIGVAMIGLCTRQAIQLRRRRLPLTHLRLSVWWSAALPLSWILTRTTPPVASNIWTPLWVVLLAVVVPDQIARSRRATVVAAVVVLAGAILQYHECGRFARRVADLNAPKKQLFDEIAALLVREPQPARYGLFFDEVGGLPNSQALYSHGVDVPMPQFFMSVHDSYYQSRFNAELAEPCAEQTIAEMEATPGALAFSICNPEDAWKNSLFAGKQAQPPIGLRYEQIICRYLQVDPRWEAVTTFDCSSYGRIGVFRLSSKPLSVADKWRRAPQARWSFEAETEPPPGRTDRM